MAAVCFLLFGTAALVSGVLGSQVFSFGATSHSYYRVIVMPLPYYGLWGVLGILLAVVLFRLPVGRDKK